MIQTQIKKDTTIFWQEGGMENPLVVVEKEKHIELYQYEDVIHIDKTVFEKLKKMIKL